MPTPQEFGRKPLPHETSRAGKKDFCHRMMYTQKSPAPDSDTANLSDLKQVLLNQEFQALVGGVQGHRVRHYGDHRACQQ